MGQTGEKDRQVAGQTAGPTGSRANRYVNNGTNGETGKLTDKFDGSIRQAGSLSSSLSFDHYTRVQNSMISRHQILHLPTSLGVSEVSERAKKRTKSAKVK